MVTAGDFKNGITLEMDNAIWQVIEFQHVKPGKGAAFVRTKLKNIVSGGVVEKSFRPTEKFTLAHIERKEYQYLYADGDLYNFMNTATGATKPAIVETGAKILVPLFVNQGDTVKIDTRTGEYLSRV